MIYHIRASVGYVGMYFLDKIKVEYNGCLEETNFYTHGGDR